MYTKEEIENFFLEQNVELISIESKPRKNKFNREVQVVVRCCVDGCQETVTKCFRNYTVSKNFGCKDHCTGLRNQKYKETQKQSKIEKTTGIEETKEEKENDANSNEDTIAVVNNEIVPVDSNGPMISDKVELTEDLKTQFLKNHYFFEYNGQAWTKAKDVARFLDFKETRCIIYTHISKSDKFQFKQFPDTIQKSIISGMSVLNTHSKINNQPISTVHPETVFINDEECLIYS